MIVDRRHVSNIVNMITKSYSDSSSPNHLTPTLTLTLTLTRSSAGNETGRYQTALHFDRQGTSDERDRCLRAIKFSTIRNHGPQRNLLSRMPHNRLGLIRLLQKLLLLTAQLLPTSPKRLIHPLHRTEPNDRRRNPPVNPRQRHMAHLPPPLPSNLLHAPHNLAIGLALLRPALLLPLAAGRGPKSLERPRQVPAAQRRPRDQTDARGVAEGVHLALLLAVEQVVVVLHADELGPAVLVGGVLEQGELPGPHAAGTDVVHFASAHEVVQGEHCFFDWRVGVEAVDLQEVEVV
jgi:hypothetical protein